MNCRCWLCGAFNCANTEAADWRLDNHRRLEVAKQTALRLILVIGFRCKFNLIIDFAQKQMTLKRRQINHAFRIIDLGQEPLMVRLPDIMLNMLGILAIKIYSVSEGKVR